MNIEKRIEVLSSLGNELDILSKGGSIDGFPGFETIKVHNPWFTEENVKFCFQNWAEQLSSKSLHDFCHKYPLSDELSENRIAIVMAGNIPMVGFHDFACAFLCGTKITAKLSSKDNVLMKWIIDRILQKAPQLNDRIDYTEERLGDFDAVIATGNNNTNRYFEHYFAKYNKILRHNRNSVAIITGKEDDNDLQKLADDVFRYFGLGCRSISKLYIPKNYDFNPMGKAFQKYADAINHNKYNNNFSYQYAVVGMNKIEHVNFGNLLLIEKQSLASPIGVLHFEYYENIEDVRTALNTQLSEIQCIVSKDAFFENSINFGETQTPSIFNFADNIDTMEFILGL
ncbi:MAG: acyl-CoA reductase [Bacteroidales bacterium]|nr:acyl-CoA reductase [Bacteroidales bacterium]